MKTMTKKNNLWWKVKPKEVVKGEGMTFYSPEEVKIAFNEKRLDLHASIKVKVDNIVKISSPFSACPNNISLF